jgi:hypothetical protein
MPGSWDPWEFPNLKETDYRTTSDPSGDYNCIAWAVHDNSKKWDPDYMNQNYWPPGVPRIVEMEAVRAAFQTKGFEDCDDDSFEDGIEEIALYATSNGKPTHAARQLENGMWTSKLGDYEDIEHQTLDCLNGEKKNWSGTIQCYGKPVGYMKRVRPAKQSTA